MTFEPDRYDFVIRKGTTFYHTITFYQDASRTQPFDLTGYSASLIIEDKGVVLKTLDTSSGGITLGDVLGTIDISIPLSDVNALTWKRGQYQLTITNTSGLTDPLLWGVFTVKP